jgi:hypothetical protein
MHRLESQNLISSWGQRGRPSPAADGMVPGRLAYHHLADDDGLGRRASQKAAGDGDMESSAGHAPTNCARSGWCAVCSVLQTEKTCSQQGELDRLVSSRR